jgi:hypothetical protein
MLVGHSIYIPRHVIGQNIHVKFLNFLCEMKMKMIENDKNMLFFFQNDNFWYSKSCNAC